MWEITATSSAQGGTPIYYRALTGTGPRLLPESWTQTEITSLQFIWPEMSLISILIEDQEYEDIIAFIENGSTDRSPKVEQIQ